MPLTGATLAIVPVAVPVAVSVKSLASTPETASLSVTVKSTLVARVGVGLARSIEEIVGETPSTSVEAVLPKPIAVVGALLPPASLSVPPLSVIVVPTVMPSGSRLPEATVYRKVSFVVPLPET